MKNSALEIASTVALHSPRRVLILRSCRPVEFAAAVRFARGRHPGAEVVALSHKGHRDSLRAAGVDDVIELPGRRFGAHRLAPWRLLKLRTTRFDEVVIPQMTARREVHLNLYWLVGALRFDRVAILPGDEPPQLLQRAAFLRTLPSLSIRAVVNVVDVPLLLALLIVARVVKPRRVEAGAHGKRRVLHIVPTLGLGGAQRQLSEVVNSTPPDGYEIDVLVFWGSGGDFSAQWLTRDDVTITYLGEPRLSYLVLAIARHCRARRYDVVHTWLCLANAVGGAGARLAGVPCVVTAVRSLSLWKKTWYRQWWYRPVDILSARLATAVTVNARALAQDYAAWTWTRESRIDVVHNGLDPSRFLADRLDSRRRLLQAAHAQDEALLVGTVGRLAHEKDHKLFLRVLGEARRVYPNVHGVIVGDGPLRAELEAYAAGLGLADAVSFLGERKDAVRLMAGLDLFVLPSIIEGFPNALLEAVFLGIPSIATRVGGCPDVLDDPGLTFGVGDDTGALTAVLAAIGDPASATWRARRVRARALEMFTASHTTTAWLNLYERCLTEAFQR
ncbi:MAG TPA: glycosyltransferase [Vicinamibacterales bacterium]|nr:glycosyltransferase [Vicinamibacterales bacterium]